MGCWRMGYCHTDRCCAAMWSFPLGTPEVEETRLNFDQSEATDGRLSLEIHHRGRSRRHSHPSHRHVFVPAIFQPLQLPGRWMALPDDYLLHHLWRTANYRLRCVREVCCARAFHPVLPSPGSHGLFRWLDAHVHLLQQHGMGELLQLHAVGGLEPVSLSSHLHRQHIPRRLLFLGVNIWLSYTSHREIQMGGSLLCIAANDARRWSPHSFPTARLGYWLCHHDADLYCIRWWTYCSCRSVVTSVDIIQVSHMCLQRKWRCLRPRTISTLLSSSQSLTCFAALELPLDLRSHLQFGLGRSETLSSGIYLLVLQLTESIRRCTVNWASVPALPSGMASV